MNANSMSARFKVSTDEWICDSYSIDIRFIALADEGGALRLLTASIALNPLPHQQDLGFKIKTEHLFVGQLQISGVSKKRLSEVIDSAIEGEINIYGQQLKLPIKQQYDYYSEMTHRDRWLYNLHLQIIGENIAPLSSLSATLLDNALRGATPPFDGLADLSVWLGLSDPSVNHAAPSIFIRVNPPVDLILENCKLLKDKLYLTLHAHPRFDTKSIGLALRAAPGIGLNSRTQSEGSIQWSRVRKGLREGKAAIDLENADQVLAILMIKSSAVRRHWFLEPTKARNNRLVAIQQFDPDLRMIKRAVLDATDQNKFELGVAAILFLLGFSPMVQVETDSPDLIVTTPDGSLIIVECTLRFSDFTSKLGKLVDRRGALSKALEISGHHSEILAVLVCALPRDQIAANLADLKANRITLLCKNDLVLAFDRVRHPADPDQLNAETLKRLSTSKTID